MFGLKVLIMSYLLFRKESNAAAVSTASLTRLVLKTNDKIAIYEGGAQGSRLQMAFMFSDGSSKEITQTTNQSGKTEESIVIDCPDLISKSGNDLTIKISSNCNSTAVKPEASITLPSTTVKPEPTTPSPLPTCKPNFVLLGRNCYHFNTNKVTWYDAVRNCQRLGATLAHPKDANENALLKNYIISTIKQETWWLGGTDEAKPGEWIWTHTGEKITYFDWYPGEPQNSSSEACLCYWYSTNQWADCVCTAATVEYICQQ